MDQILPTLPRLHQIPAQVKRLKKEPVPVNVLSKLKERILVLIVPALHVLLMIFNVVIQVFHLM
jgi:hypothetical protein